MREGRAREVMDLGECGLTEWAQYLAAFEKAVYPLFQRYGFTFPEAFLAFSLNRVRNAIGDASTDPPEEEWKRA